MYIRNLLLVISPPPLLTVPESCLASASTGVPPPPLGVFCHSFLPLPPFRSSRLLPLSPLTSAVSRCKGQRLQTSECLFKKSGLFSWNCAKGMGCTLWNFEVEYIFFYRMVLLLFCFISAAIVISFSFIQYLIATYSHILLCWFVFFFVCSGLSARSSANSGTCSSLARVWDEAFFRSPEAGRLLGRYRCR